MKQILLRFNGLRLLVLLAIVVGAVTNVWAQSDKSAVYTSNVTLSTTGGTSASTAKVKISSTDYDAIKAGASRTAGAMKITVPSGTKYLHLHIAAWNGETVSVSITPNGNLPVSYLALTADTGISGTESTYTLSTPAKATTDYYKVLTFKTALTSNTEFTFSAGANTTSGKRFVIWGVNSEEESVSKSPIGAFSTIADKNLSLNDMPEFDPADYFTKDKDATGTVTYTVTPGDGESAVAYYDEGCILAIGDGQQEFTVTATPAAADANSYEAVSTKFTVNVTDSRTAVETISSISPTTVYVGAIDEFTLTEDHADRVASYTWSSSDDAKLALSGELYEAKAAGDVNVTVTATPSDASTYKAATAVFPVTVAYKYAAPSLSDNNFTTSYEVTIPTVTGADVYYTTDGTAPTASSTKYTAPFTLTATTTVKAIAIDGDGLVSPVATATYTRGASANIVLTAGQTLTFSNFSGLGNTYASAPANPEFTASDGNGYKWSQVNCISSGEKLQMKKQAGVTLSSGTITSPNGFVLSLTFSGGAPSVKAGDTAQSATSSTTTTATYNIASTSTSIVITASASTQTFIEKISLTANKATNTITANTERTIDRTKNESTVTMDATSTSGSVTYAVKSSTLDNEDYSFNASTGVLTVTGTQSGTIVITASSAATSDYLAADDVDITVTVVGSKVDPTILVEDVERAFGSTYTLDISDFASGEVSLSSSNTAVATVSGLVITPVAVGTTTITVTTAEAALYKAGSDTFEFTVTAPEGGVTAAKGSTTSTVTLDFTDNSKWGFPVGSSNKTIDENSYDDGTYTLTLTGSTGQGYYFNNSDKYLLIGQNGATIELPTFDKFVTKIDVVGRTGAGSNTLQNIYVGDVAVSTQTKGVTGTNSYEIAEAYQTPGTTYTIKIESSHNSQITSIKFYLTDVATQTVTLNASGYATFCSANPIDFSKAEGYTAWYPSAITSEGVITFTKVTTAIKGGQGVLLHGDAGMENDEVTLYSAGSSEVLTGNKLVGTTAPVYLSAEGEAYGLSGKTFVKNSAAGTIGAGKAYIPADAIPTEVKSFTFVFEDLATGITETRQATREEVEAIFNLAGQRLNKMQKGVNIVNGKKVLVK